jgi:endonuclease YncB( thermonuclease family)
MSKLRLKSFFLKKPFLGRNGFCTFNLFLIIIFCLFFTGCGLFYYDTGEPNRHNMSTVSNYSDNAGNAGDAYKTGIYHGSSGINDAGDTGGSNQSNASGNDMQSGYAPGLYRVSEVIDGDTFSINSGERVRMVGINTPEVDQYFYEEAKEVLMLMIDKTSVSLEQDITDTDKYGRLLRYVFVGELFINIEMVKRGFANAFTVPPDIKYTDELLEAQRYARENNLGLWEISSGYIGENIKEEKENKTGNNTGQPDVELKTISVEVKWDAPGNDMENLNGEYAEIKNESTCDIDIGGWTIKDDATKIYEFKHYILKRSEKIFLFSGFGTDSAGNFYWNNSLPVWNNDHDTLYLRDNAGLLVEIYNY